MKPTLITLPIPNVLLVVLPEGVKDYDKDVFIIKSGPYVRLWNQFGKDELIDLPAGNWQIVGRLSEVTEADAQELVDKVMGDQHFQNYSYKSVAERWVKTAIESLESAILAENYYLDSNPYQILKTMNGEGITESGQVAYEEAQSRVLSRERTLILRTLILRRVES